MSRTTVRNQIVSYLAGQSIQDLNQVFSSFPARIQFQVNATAGQLSRAALVVFIESEREVRTALGGATSGQKRIDFTVNLQVYHHSVQSLSENAMADFDTTIDQLKAALRADHRFGDTTGTIIWQAAESDFGLSVDYGEPARTNGGATETFAGVRFEVTEMITA